jgi:hypothetical protein|tara:strand:- start:83 stop:277 length:195 start_codon:yes stop_codon:yes gene_type:complete
MKSKKPQWDGRSRIPTKKYKEEYNRIFKEDLIKSIIEVEKKAGKDLVSVIIERKMKENNDKKKS